MHRGISASVHPEYNHDTHQVDMPLGIHGVVSVVVHLGVMPADVVTPIGSTDTTSRSTDLQVESGPME